MKCSRCGTDSSGAFCSNCGAELKATRSCARCGSVLPPDARYCTQCGARAGNRAALLRWGVPAAVAVAALAIGYGLGRDVDSGSSSEAAQAPFAGNAGAPAGTGSPPPLTGSMRDQADRLFDRIMQARARGDTAEANFFMPMALQAYDGAEPLDADGLFHVGLLQLGADRPTEAAALARRIGELDANHLFGLALAGEAALASGDRTAAQRAFANYLARFESELARALPEYEMHRPALDEYRDRARALTGS